MDRKVCCTCKKEKDVAEFSKNRTREDGYQAYCKNCAKGHQETSHPSSLYSREARSPFKPPGGWRGY